MKLSASRRMRGSQTGSEGGSQLRDEGMGCEDAAGLFWPVAQGTS